MNAAFYRFASLHRFTSIRSFRHASHQRQIVTPLIKPIPLRRDQATIEKDRQVVHEQYMIVGKEPEKSKEAEQSRAEMRKEDMTCAVLNARSAMLDAEMAQLDAEHEKLKAEIDILRAKAAELDVKVLELRHMDEELDEKEEVLEEGVELS